MSREVLLASIKLQSETMTEFLNDKLSKKDFKIASSLIVAYKMSIEAYHRYDFDCAMSYKRWPYL